MAKIAVFYGTSEGRELLYFLSDFKCELAGFVATEYALEMDVPKDVNIFVGRMSQEEMAEKFICEKYDIVVDATHPYADIVTQNIKLACAKTNVKYMRVARDISQNQKIDGVKYFDSTIKACEFLKDTQGVIFLSTGSKELDVFTKYIHPDRIFARVLPAIESLELCEKAGVKRKQIVACEGPFSVQMNIAMLHGSNAKYFITKQTGSAGGFSEKVESAKRAGAVLCVITADKNNADIKEKDFDIKRAKKFFAGGLQEKNRRKITVVGMGVGDENLLTNQAKNAIKNADVLFGTGRIMQNIVAGGDIFQTYKLDEIDEILSENPQYRNVVICGTGDVGFHSVASGARERFAEKYNVESIAGIGSLAYFMAKIGKSYKDCVLTSSHGRSGNIAVLVSQNKKVFTLLGSAKDMISKLCEYNLAGVKVWIGENLSYENEKIWQGSCWEFLGKEFCSLAVAYIENESANCKTDLEDSDFVRGKIPMTKQDIRRLVVARLNLSKDSVVYDIGAGTGSVSCACGKLLQKGKCYAVECASEGVALIKENAKRLQLDNIEVVDGFAPDALADLPAPTHAFIGGSRGNMAEIVQCVLDKNSGVKIVATAVTIETCGEIISVAKQKNLQCESALVSVANAEKLGGYNLMKGENPVYIFTLQNK